MIRVQTLLADVLTTIRRHHRPLLVFHLIFTGLAMAFLIPASTWPLAALRHITGQSVISTGGLLAFLTSPSGLLWILATLSLTALLAVLQQAGMILIPAINRSGARYRTAATALWTVARRFHRLFMLTVVQITAHVLLASPFLVVVGIAYEHLLMPYETHALRLEKPPALWGFIGIGIIAAAGIALCNGWLYLRWVLALPLLMLENRSVGTALRRSSELARGHRLHITTALLGMALMVMALPLIFTLLFGTLGGHVLSRLPDRMSVIAPAVLIYLTLYAILTIALAFLGTALNSLLLHALCLRATGAHPCIHPSAPPDGIRPLAWSAEVLLIVFAIGQAGYALQSFDGRDTVAITAHRGSPTKAPENTISAIEQAIEDGADYIEVDVRQTADGTLVLWHDRKLERLTGRNDYIWEVTYDSIRDLDPGSGFSPAFTGESIATLEQAIEVVRGRARLYIEIKPASASPTLTRDVIALLRDKDLLDGTVIASMSRAVIREAARLEPRLSLTLFAELILGPLDRSEFDALGLRFNRVTPAQVANARRHDHELHVWTVNDPADMSRFLDMGVDNIITDRPDLLAELLDERARLSDTERLLVKLHNWLRY